MSTRVASSPQTLRRYAGPGDRTITFWLIGAGGIVTSLRARADSPDDVVREIAIDWLERVPLCYPIPPYEQRSRIQNAVVATHPEGN